MKPETFKGFMHDAKRELKYTVAHRRGIILGYSFIGLDSLKKQGIISENERRQGHWDLKLYYDHL